MCVSDSCRSSSLSVLIRPVVGRRQPGRLLAWPLRGGSAEEPSH